MNSYYIVTIRATVIYSGTIYRRGGGVAMLSSGAHIVAGEAKAPQSKFMV